MGSIEFLKKKDNGGQISLLNKRLLFLDIIRILKGKQFLDLSPDRELWPEVGLGDGGDDDGQLVVEVIEAIPWPLAAAKEKPV